MILLTYAVYIGVGFFIAGYMKKLSRVAARIFLWVFCLWPLVEVFAVPAAVLQMNCHLAASPIYKAVPVSTYFRGGLTGFCSGQCMNSIFDGKYEEIQMEFPITKDGVFSRYNTVFSFHRTGTQTPECELGKKLLGDENERGDLCVGATPIPKMTARYVLQDHSEHLDTFWGLKIQAQGQQYVDVIGRTVMAQQNNIYVRNNSWPIINFIDEKFGHPVNISCTSPFINVEDVFLPESK